MMSRVKVSLPSRPGFSMMPSTADSPQFMVGFEKRSLCDGPIRAWMAWTC